MPRLVISPEEVERLYGITFAFWREWISYCWVVLDRAIRIVGAKREWLDLRDRM